MSDMKELDNAISDWAIEVYKNIRWIVRLCKDFIQIL